MERPAKKLKIIEGLKKKATTIGFYCPKCDRDSAYSDDMNPPTCIRCGYIYENKFKTKKKKF